MIRKDTTYFRKGNIVLDILVVFVSLFILGAFMIIANKAQTDLNADMQNSTDLTNQSKEIMQNNTDSFPSIYDYAYVTILVLLWAVLLISSFVVDNHPVFFIFMVILLLVSILVPAILANTIDELGQDADLSSSYDEYPKMKWIINHYVQIFVVIGLSVIVVFFAKLKG